jgi:DNA-binding beta-propeller fold protein YncE
MAYRSRNTPPFTGVITVLKVNKGKPGSVLGPTALAYNKKNDTMYVADGASNILYAFSKAYDFLDQPKAIVIGSTGKTFTGPEAKNAKVLYSGTALSGSVSMALLPNGNLIVANTKSNNLVEIESTGAILDTKSVDSGAGGAIRGILAVGTSDTNTVLYFTDVNANNVQELSK